MKQPSPLVVSIIFAIILVFLAYCAMGQPPAIPMTGAQNLEATNQAQRTMAIKAAAVAPPPLIFVETNTISVANNLIVAIRDGTAKTGATSNVIAPFWIKSTSANSPTLKAFTNLLQVPAGQSNFTTNFASQTPRRFYSAH